MTTQDPSTAIQTFASHDALVPFLPLVYVAWADGDLEPDEIQVIRERVAALDCFPSDAQASLEGWLDPAAPPTAAALAGLLEALRSSSGGLSAPERLGLKELGLELARAGGQDVKPSEQEALIAIEEALGIASREASQRILRPFIRRAPIDHGDPSFEAEELQAVLDGSQRELRDRIRTLLSGPEFAYEYGLPKEAYREKILGWCRRLAEEGLGSLGYPEACGGKNDARAF
ncbi:MAG: tellurite resistance TerB family protein, partial [Planctomycetota bacterium]